MKNSFWLLSSARHAAVEEVAQLRQVAVREGMTTLREDAWRKVQAGLTTVEEAVRVTGDA